MFKNLNIIEILRVGLSGLTFLFAFLAYGLIRREQQFPKQPRKDILRTIYIFIGANLVASVIVAFVPYIVGEKKENPDDDLQADTYIADYTSYLVDLTKWTETTLGPVLVTRTDFVRKVRSTNVPYIIPYFTTGQSIICKPITFSSRPQFIGPKNDPGSKGLQYDYVLPIGHEPAGYTEMASSQFIFPSGFKDPKKEWWEASVSYPSKTISVVFRFPVNKTCKDMTVSRIEGLKAKQPIFDNLPTRSENGDIVTWVGLNESGNVRIQFDWEW